MSAVMKFSVIKPSQASRAVDRCEECITRAGVSALTSESHLVRRNLERLILEKSELQTVEESLSNSREDLRLVAADSGAVVTFKTVVLASTSRLFRRLHQRRSDFDARSHFLLSEVTLETLRDVKSFVLSGRIELRADNIERLFLAALHLEMDALVDACREYLARFFADLAEIILRLGSHHCAVEPLAERLRRELCSDPLKYARTLTRLSAESFVSLITRRDFSVMTEDAVASLVLHWKCNAEASSGEDQPEVDLALLHSIRFGLVSQAMKARLRNIFGNVVADFEESQWELKGRHYRKLPRPGYFLGCSGLIGTY